MIRNRRLIAFLVVIALLCVGCTGGDETASKIQLTKTQGTVDVSDENAKAVSLVESAELHSGYYMETEEKSYAWIALGGAKTAKVDENSEIEIQKEGTELEVVVASGKVFFDVAKPLKEGESFRILTPTMTVDVQESCGWVEVLDDARMNIFILAGTVECSVTDSESGEDKIEQVSGREKAELRFYSKKASGTSGISKDKLNVYEIPSYVLEEVLADNGLRGRINSILNMQIPKDGSSQAYFLRGIAHISDGETKENIELARANYEKALELDKKNGDAYLGLADLKIREAEYEEAMGILEEGLSNADDKAGIEDKIAEMEGGEYMDFQGNMRRRIFYRDGKVAWQHDYSYDEQGRRIKIMAYDASGEKIGGGDELYDDEGRILQTYAWETQNGKLMKEVYEYDENGNQVKRKVYDTDDVFTYYRENEYDEDGNLVKCDQYDAAGYLDTYFTYEYDEDGNQIKRNHYSASGRMILYHIYDYDEDGNCVRDRSFHGDGELREDITYEYDEYGNLMEK